ncbi:Orotidine 5'-phosphate decarboxylase [hydrothermal vent metagenome]|uniref:Orotidine 5'-phosphate decarboxylase n=1 Tax=hydrothermal vent metagenome TaxID=652676 RepID=A0A3B1DF34_9ZZZZ
MNRNTLDAKDRIILALDFPSFEMARPYIQKLKTHVGIFKVGLTLFIREGLPLLERISDISGTANIFLDLKLYDTPMQVGSAAAVLHKKAPELRFLTVHSSGGLRVLKSVVDAMPGGTEILGVTALTSQSPAEAKVSDKAALQEQVLGLAALAKDAGAAGVVASAYEAAALKKHFGNRLTLVIPGIRPDWSEVSEDDQRRTMTPAQAISQGADYLVIGRPICGDSDPVGAAAKIADEIASV